MTAEAGNSGREINLSKKKKALFSVVIFSVFLILLEAALRLFDVIPHLDSLRQDPGLIKKADNAMGYVYTPGWKGYHAGTMVTINSAGWRGRNFSPDKSDGTVRILGIGDSFTFGRAVEDDDVFLSKLEAMFNADADSRYEALNAGHENMDTVKELAYLKELDMLKKLKPDMVILGFTVHNDAQPSSNRKVYRKLKRKASLMLRVSESNWFKNLADSFRIARVFRAGARWMVDDELADLYARIIASNYKEDSKSWKACREALRGIARACRENNTPMILALFPVYTKKLHQTYEDYPEEFRKIHTQIKSVLSDESGVVTIDMLDDLAATGLTINQIRVPVDGHPNPIWHEIVARRLHETIEGMGLKPTESGM